MGDGAVDTAMGLPDAFARQVVAFGEWADGYIDELNEFRSSWGFSVLPIPRLSSVFRLLIGEYPKADEDKSAELGEAWVEEAERAVEFLRDAQLALDAVTGSWNGGAAAPSMGMAFTELVQAVNDYATTASSYAKGAYDFNNSVVLAKNAFQASLLLLCYELIRAALAAVFTMGGSFLTVPPAIVVARNGTRIAVTQALQRVSGIFIQQTLRRLGLRGGTVATQLGARTFAGAAARGTATRSGGLLTNTVARQQSRQLLREVVALAAARGATPALRRQAVKEILSNPAVRRAIQQQVAAKLAGRSVPFASAVTREQAALITAVVRRTAERGVVTRGGVRAFTTGNLLRQRVIGYGLQSALKFGIGADVYAQLKTMAETDGRYDFNLRSTAAAFVGASLGGAPLGLAGRLPGFVVLGATGGVAGYAGAAVVTHAEKVWDTVTDPGKLWDAATNVDQLWKNDRIRQEIADAALGGAIGGAWERHIGERSWHEVGQGLAVRNVIATGQAPDLGNLTGSGAAPAIAQLGQEPVAGATSEADPAAGKAGGTATGGTAAGAAAQSGAASGGAGQGGASGSGGSNTGHGGGARTGGGAAGSGGSGGSSNGRPGTAAPGDDGGNEQNGENPDSGKPKAGDQEQRAQEQADPAETGDRGAEQNQPGKQEPEPTRTGEQETEQGRTGNQQTEPTRTGEQEAGQSGDQERRQADDRESGQTGSRERAAAEAGQADPGRENGRAGSENTAENRGTDRGESAATGSAESGNDSTDRAEGENRESTAGRPENTGPGETSGDGSSESTGTPDAGRSETPGEGTSETTSSETGRTPDESARPDGLRELGSVTQPESLRLEPPSPPEDPVRAPESAAAGVSRHLADLIQQGLGSLDVDAGIYTAQATTGEVVQVALVMDDDLPAGEFHVLPGEFELTPAGHVQTAPAEIRLSTTTTQYPATAAELGQAQTGRALNHLLATTPVIASGAFTAAHGRTPLPAGQTDVRAFVQPPPRTVQTAPGTPGTTQESEQLLHEEIARRQTETTITISDSDPIAIAGTPGQTLLVHYAQAGTDVAVDLTVDPTLAPGEVQARAPGWRNDDTSTLRQTGPGEVRVSTAGTPEQMRSMVEAGLRALHEEGPGRSSSETVRAHDQRILRQLHDFRGEFGRAGASSVPGDVGLATPVLDSAAPDVAIRPGPQADFTVDADGVLVWSPAAPRTPGDQPGLLHGAFAYRSDPDPPSDPRPPEAPRDAPANRAGSRSPEAVADLLERLGVDRHAEAADAWLVRLPDGREAVLRIVDGELVAAQSPESPESVPLSRTPKGRKELQILVGMALQRLSTPAEPARVPFQFERFFNDPRWMPEAIDFERRLGAYYFNDETTLNIARTTVARLRDVLEALVPRTPGEPDAEFTQRVESAFFRDDEDAKSSAGQVGTRVTLDELLAEGNLRELTTAFYNAAYFNRDSPYTLGKAILAIFDDDRWEQASAAGMDLEVLREVQRQLDESISRPVVDRLEQRVLGTFRFARDPFATANAVLLSERGARDLAEVVRSQHKRRAREEGEQQELGLITTAGHYADLNAPLGRFERDFIESHIDRTLELDTPLPWREGVTAHDIGSGRWVDGVTADGIPVVDGISGTTTRMLLAVRPLGLAPEHTEQFLGALMGWMLPGRDHSLFEILRGAQIANVVSQDFGGGFTAVDLYRNLPGLDLRTLRTEVLPDGLFPHEARYLQHALDPDGFTETQPPSNQMVRETADRLWPQLRTGEITDADLADWLRENGIDPADPAAVRALSERLSKPHLMALTVYTRHSHYLINNVTRTRLWTGSVSEALVRSGMAQKVRDLVSDYLENLAAARTPLPLPLALRPLLHVGEGHLSRDSPLTGPARTWVDAARRVDDAMRAAREHRVAGRKDDARRAESDVRAARRDQRAAWRQIREHLDEVVPQLFEEMRWHADMVHDAMLQLPAVGSAEVPVRAYRGDWLTPVYSPIYGSPLLPHGTTREFLSVSRDLSVAVRFMAENPASGRKVLVVYRLTGEQARDLSVFSAFAADREAVFPPRSGTRRVPDPELAEEVRREALEAAESMVELGVLDEVPREFDVIVIQEDP